MPKRSKRSGAPARGYAWKETTSGKIPNPVIVPVATRKIKLKPMRTIMGGTTGMGKAFVKINNRTRSK